MYLRRVSPGNGALYPHIRSGQHNGPGTPPPRAIKDYVRGGNCAGSLPEDDVNDLNAQI